MAVLQHESQRPFAYYARRLVNRRIPAASARTGTAARLSRFVVTQVRHALQQAVAIGACSAYFPAT
jgi:hypothetical protein